MDDKDVMLMLQVKRRENDLQLAYNSLMGNILDFKSNGGSLLQEGWKGEGGGGGVGGRGYKWTLILTRILCQNL